VSMELYRYIRRIGSADLSELLANPSLVNSEPVNMIADFSTVKEVLASACSDDTGRIDLASLDGHLAEPLHQAMPELPHRLATDMRFWHWLCIAGLPDVVWCRWYGRVPDSPADVLAGNPSMVERFLGAGTLRGTSRNALARLWWCAESLCSGQNGYGLARQALARQDLFQAIFERQFGLYPPAARACLRRFGNSGVSEREWRDGTRRLNHYLTTIVLEALSEDEIMGLLSE
jgi:Family of unknown function (DUF6339)